MVLLLLGCAAPPSSADSAAPASISAVAEGEILGGEPVTEDAERATVSLHTRTSRSVSTSPYCSGTLVAPQWVLTAGHCVTGRRGKKSPGAVAVYVGDDPRVDLDDHVYAVDAVRRHPDFDATTLAADIALLHLATAVTEVGPARILGAAEGVTDTDVGASVDLVGFGTTETGDYGARRRVVLPIAAMGCPTSVGCPAGYEGAPWDVALFSYRQSGVATAHEDDEGPCSGDSGGPALLERDGDWYVAGVSSFGDASCRTYGASLSVSAYEAWVEGLTGDLNGA